MHGSKSQYMRFQVETIFQGQHGTAALNAVQLTSQYSQQTTAAATQNGLLLPESQRALKCIDAAITRMSPLGHFVCCSNTPHCV